MTRDDFEKITAIPAVKSGKVRIELQYLGFTIIASNPYQQAVGETRISYRDADEMTYPVLMFEKAISMLQASLG